MEPMISPFRPTASTPSPPERSRRLSALLPEIWLLVFPYLKTSDLRSISLTCSTFRYMAQPLLFSILDVSPFLLSYNAEHPILRPRQYLTRFLERLQYYKRPYIAHGVQHCWISPYSRSGFPVRNQQDDLDPHLIIDAVMEALPSFTNLTTLSWHCIDINLKWWNIIQSLGITNMWLNSSSIPLNVETPLPGIRHLDLDQWPWEGRVTNHVSVHEERTHGVDTVALQYVIQPDIIRYISVPRNDTACHLFSILCQATYHLRSLKVPFSSVSDPNFIHALRHCPSLVSLCMFPPQSDERSRDVRIEGLTQSTLPSLTEYEGPYSHVLQFAMQPLKRVALWGFDDRPSTCDPDALAETLDDLADTETANTLEYLRVSVTGITQELLEILAMFGNLVRVTMQSQDSPARHLPIPHNLKASVPVASLYNMMNEISLPPRVQHVRFSTRLGSSKLDIAGQEHEAATFMESFASRHPAIQRMEVGYGIYWTGMYTAVWGRLRENMEMSEGGGADHDEDNSKPVMRSNEDGGFSSKSSSKDFVVSTVVSSVHPLPLGKLTFTEHRRKILFPQDTSTISSVGETEVGDVGQRGFRFWTYFWIPFRRLFGKAEQTLAILMNGINVERANCTRVQDYPFIGTAVFKRLSGSLIHPEHPLFRMVQFLEKWETVELFGSHKLDALRFQGALGWTKPPPPGLERPPKESITSRSTPLWERICRLFTVYLLVDICNRYGILGPLPRIVEDNEGNPRPRRARSLEPLLISKCKIWEKLEAWTATLKEARQAQEKDASVPRQAMPPEAKNNPHYALVLGLARCRVKRNYANIHGNYTNIRANFMAAALCLSYMMAMPGVATDAAVLPDIPENVRDLLRLIGVNSSLSVSPLQEIGMKDFCKEYRAQQVRLPLQLALMISPICLLTVRSTDIKRFERETLMKLATSLGTYRPPELEEIEKEILRLLFCVASVPESLDEGFARLCHSEIWRKCEALGSSSEAARFFIPDQGTHITNVDGASDQPRISSLENKRQEHQERPPNLNDIHTQISPEPTTSKPTTATPTKPTRTAQALTMTIMHLTSATTTPMTRYAEPTTRPFTTSAPMTTMATTSMPSTSESTTPGPTRPRVDDEDGDGGEGVATGGQADEAMNEDEDDEGNEGGGGPDDDAMDEDDEDEGNLGEGEPDPAMDEDRPRRPLRNARGDTAMRGLTSFTRSNQRSKEPPSTETGREFSNTNMTVNNGMTDVDLWAERKITLEVQHKATKKEGLNMTAYMPSGETKVITPYVHDQATLESLEALWRPVESNYHLNKPRFLYGSEFGSSFCVIKAEDMDLLSEEKIQEALTKRHLVVRARDGYQEPTFKEALQDIGSLDTVTTIHDWSVITENQNDRRREGTLRQLLEASGSRDGKVLHALDIGLLYEGVTQSGYASNVAALLGLRGEWKSSNLRSEDVNWALAATSGAFHTWHIDCNGFVTVVSPVCGMKLWMVGKPNGSTDNPLARVNLFSPREFKANITNPAFWDLEAILLQPGDTLVMRPNTPHAVFTPTPSVLRGGRCYARATLPDTLVGIIHAFIAGEQVTITKNLNRSARFHLQAMISFYHRALITKILDENDNRWNHVPDLETDAGHRELLAICVFGVLANVLDFRTYLHPRQGADARTDDQRQEMIDKDCNSMTQEERIGCMKTRAQSLQLLEYAATCYTVSESNKWADLRDFQEDVIAHQCAVISSYKIAATKDSMAGVPGCDYELLRTQIDGVAVKGSRLAEKIQTALESSPSHYQDMSLLELGESPEGWEDMTIVEECRASFVHPLKCPVNERDRIYLAAEGLKLGGKGQLTSLTGGF